MSYVVVMPWIWEPYMVDCLAGSRLENLLLVDNSDNNRGIMRSHNHGVDFMRAADADWLVCLSAAIRFGPAGGLDFIDALEQAGPLMVVSANHTYGWHLIAFRRELIEQTGRWDENFSPYGYDDIDYSIRYHKVFGVNVPAAQVDVDVSDTIMGHSLKLAGVKTDNRRLLDYLTVKWGREHGQPFDDYYDRPWNDATNPVGYWPDVNGARWDEPAPITYPLPAVIA